MTVLIVILIVLIVARVVIELKLIDLDEEIRRLKR